jgi:tetratricopeptide (TPR) repeat protein
MSGYSANEVEKMLGLSPARLRAYVRAGLLTPERGAEGELRFSFQDLRLLRNAEGLVRGRIAPHRVRRALQSVRARLNGEQPLSAVQLEAEGSGLVVRDGGARWQAESGQLLLDLAAPSTVPAPAEASIARLHPPRPAAEAAAAEAPPLSAQQLYESAARQEEIDPQQARETYLQVLTLVPTHADAHIDLGRLLHQSGDLRAAEFHYRNALTARPGDSTAAFNLGVALEDQGQVSAAIDAYEKALASNPENADAHYNAARLYEKAGDYPAARRHLRAYRQLSKR